MIMDNLETSLATTVDKACGNRSGATVERFIKPIASAMFLQPVYFLVGPGSSITVSGPHEDFFNSDFDLWIGGNNFSYGCCRPIRTHKVWRAFRLRHIILEQISILRQYVAMRRAIVVPGKHVISALILALKEAETKA